MARPGLFAYYAGANLGAGSDTPQAGQGGGTVAERTPDQVVHIKPMPFTSQYRVTLESGDVRYAEKEFRSPSTRSLVDVRTREELAVLQYRDTSTFKHAGKLIHRGFDAALAAPGLLGFGVGLALPFLLPFKWSAGIGTAIAIGGYASPQGSWLRRFSIGAGLGAGSAAAFHYRAELATVVETAVDIKGAFDVLGQYPWTHWIPVVGPFLETLDPTP
jgi:hypothetical protein